MDIYERFWEVDVFRGLAILMMVIYHLFFDLTYFGICQLDVSSEFFYSCQNNAFIFIFVGVSLTLSSLAPRFWLKIMENNFF